MSVLNDVAAKHGVGRVDIVENRLVGMKSRGCYETPGGTVMMAALQAIDELVLDKVSRSWKTQLSEQFAQLLYDGRWFTPLQQSVMSAAQSLCATASGEVVLKLYKGSVTAVQKRSPHSLYSEDFATFGADEVYNRAHAEGFIRLFSSEPDCGAAKQQRDRLWRYGADVLRQDPMPRFSSLMTRYPLTMCWRSRILPALKPANALQKVGVLSAEECEQLQQALDELLGEVRSDPAAVAVGGDEDIHSFVEAALM